MSTSTRPRSETALADSQHAQLIRKRMLYDFHVHQNSHTANSVHATYLIHGLKSSQSSHDDGDVEMSSSMPESNAYSDEIPTVNLSLVAEAGLEG
jgi:DNA polymerase delta subunit 3